MQVFSIKKEDVQIYFKTLPGPKITALRLGGATGENLLLFRLLLTINSVILGTPTDKTFVASGNEVRGYTKKGKLFLSFDSNLTESITSMYF